MYARAGLWRRSAPFVGVMILAIAVLPLPPAGDGPTEIALASALTALILGTVWLAPWHRLPAFAEVVPALSYFVVVALLRESQGGALSGYSVLAMLPVFWLALYGTRDQLAIGIAGSRRGLLRAVAPARRSRVPVHRMADRDPVDLRRAHRRLHRPGARRRVALSGPTETRLALANIEAITVAMREIGASTDPDGAVRQAVCVSARSIAGADVVQLLEPNADGRLALTAAAGMRIPRAGEESGGGLAFLTRKPVFVRDATHGARHGIRSMHFEPILRDENAVAVLVLGWTKPVKRLSQGVESGMQMLSAEAAIALDRARLLVQLQETARTDDLTGLPNRRAWDEELPRELARAARDARPVCVAMLDLDRFKRFNDHRGHQAGDRLLKQAASAWSSLLRASDMLARYGGEEFSLLLPGCTIDDAQRLVGRLRAAMPDGRDGLGRHRLLGRDRDGRRLRRPGGFCALRREARRPQQARHGVLGGRSTANGSVTSSVAGSEAEQRRRPAARPARLPSPPGRLEDAAPDQDPVEVRRRDVVSERGSVQLAQLRERELVRREGEADVRVRQLRPQARQARANDVAVVERGPLEPVDGQPLRVLRHSGICIARDQAEIGGRELPVLRIALRLASGLELLEVGELPDVHLGGELAPDRLLERLAAAPGSRPAGPSGLERIPRPLPHEHLQRAVPDLEDDSKRDVQRGGSDRLRHQV